MATAEQSTLRENYFLFQSEIDPALGSRMSSSIPGHRAMNASEIGWMNIDGSEHFFVHIIDRPYLGTHSVDQDPDCPMIQSDWPMQIPNDIFHLIEESMPPQFRGRLPTQTLFYFFNRPVTLEDDSGNIRQLLFGEREEVRLNHFCVKWIKPNADATSMRFRTPECPFEFWTHGTRNQALSAAITEVSEHLTNPMTRDDEKPAIQNHLAILQGAKQIETVYATCQKRLIAQEKKLQDAQARYEQDPTASHAQLRWDNDSIGISQQITSLQEQITQAEQNLATYKVKNAESLPHSYVNATFQVGFTTSHGEFFMSKRLKEGGNTSSTGLIDQAQHQVRNEEISQDNAAHMRYPEG